jgi:hypothetical protein
MSDATYREIPFRHGVCAVCDEIHPVTDHTDQPSYVNKWGIRQKPLVLFMHGPAKDRCEGSHTQPKPWLEASHLPAWDELSDLDKGAALLHVWKCHWEHSASYAVEHYPAEYFEHPLLTGLDSRTASRHASVVAGRWDDACERLGDDEVTRLYDLALVRDREVATARVEAAR